MKRRIMNWAKVNKPHLVGYTKMPAINWFTPSKARTLLKKHGFELVYDRWDLRKLTERGGVRGLALRMICLTRATKIFADLAVAGCSYAATKPLKYRP
jgi:hypothetical protein